MDASAATLASSGRNVGVAPLGTSLTDEQAGQLAFYGKNPIVATDADLAGRVAAERDLWILTPHRLDPRYARLPEGSDPADLLARHGPAALTAAVDQAWPLGYGLVFALLPVVLGRPKRAARTRSSAHRHQDDHCRRAARQHRRNHLPLVRLGMK